MLQLYRCIIRGAILRIASRALLLPTRSRSFHGRRRLRQPFVDQNLHFYATILGAAFTRFVISDRFQLAKAVRRNDAAEWNLVLLDQVTNHRIRATLTKCAVQRRASG